MDGFFNPPLLVTDRSSSPWLLYTAMANTGQSVFAAVPDGPWCQ